MIRRRRPNPQHKLEVSFPEICEYEDSYKYSGGYDNFVNRDKRTTGYGVTGTMQSS